MVIEATPGGRVINNLVILLGVMQEKVTITDEMSITTIVICHWPLEMIQTK